MFRIGIETVSREAGRTDAIGTGGGRSRCDSTSEEAEGNIRWLRPEYQNPNGATAAPTLNLPESEPKKSGTRGARPSKAKVAKQAWPKSLAERVKAVSDVIRRAEMPVTADEVAKAFKRADAKDVGEILETLCVMGQAHRGKAKGTYLP